MSYHPRNGIATYFEQHFLISGWFPIFVILHNYGTTLVCGTLMKHKQKPRKQKSPHSHDNTNWIFRPAVQEIRSGDQGVTPLCQSFHRGVFCITLVQGRLKRNGPLKAIPSIHASAAKSYTGRQQPASQTQTQASRQEGRRKLSLACFVSRQSGGQFPMEQQCSF